MYVEELSDGSVKQVNKKVEVRMQAERAVTKCTDFSKFSMLCFAGTRQKPVPVV